MRKTTKLHLILLPVLVLMLVFCVSVAEARGGSFVIEPMQEAVENVNLGVSDQVFGNLSVRDGYVDLFITNPSGTTVQGFHNISSINFNFVANESGTYSMRLNNTYQVYDVTVELKHSVSMTVNAQVGVNVGISSGFIQVMPPPTRPLEPDDNEPTDYLIKPYLNFLRAADILKTVTNARTILPIRNVALMSIIASIAGLTVILNPRRRRSDIHAHARPYNGNVEWIRNAR